MRVEEPDSGLHAVVAVYGDAAAVAKRALAAGIPQAAFVPMDRYAWDGANASDDDWTRFVVPYDALDAETAAHFADLAFE